MTSQGMVLRNMALVGLTKPTVMPADHWPAFESGVQALFSKWTALQLGVMNEWGGPRSKEKAEDLYEEVLNWFHSRKNHEMQDLADYLDQCISEDFNIQAEDDSPYQLARTMVNMYNQIAIGDYSYVNHLVALPGGGAAAISQADQSGVQEESSSSEDEDEASDDDEEMRDAAMDVDPVEAAAPRQRGPVVDDDGFELVQRKGRGGRGGRR